MMKIYASIKSTLAALSFAGMTIVSSQAFAGYGSIYFSPTNLNATVGSYYSQTLTTTDFTTGNYNFNVIGSTFGLTITNPGGGNDFLISGTPTGSGRPEFLITGADSSGYDFIGGPSCRRTCSSLGQTFYLTISDPISGGGAPEIDGSLAPKVGFLLGCLFLMFGRKKQDTEPMMAA
ncbi:hypothetical protein [Polynucleobacter sp. P1-05-14]|uniref:hypothetical protein n=1 Tax=Polynucleobacter sp. P1-05-14 TaxID=1819732 RepID=UPI001C0DB9FC|nr:hypothetical protein [Polynucleobacter sp. P1-05-14]MBU3548874.1 hypothetical protein [Polynucleobacter sp. P1-05-14]